MDIMLRFLLVCWSVLSGVGLAMPACAIESDTESMHAAGSGTVDTTLSGPWGELQSFETSLIAPQSLVDMFVRPTTETVWRFPGWTRKQLDQALAEITFLPGQLDWIDEPDGIFKLKDEVRLYPTDEMITGMTARQRLKLHKLLARWPENRSHQQPQVLSEPGEAKKWFRDAGLPVHVADEIGDLCFQCDGEYLFAEVEFIMKRLDDEALQNRFLRALTRTPGLIVRLKVTEDTDLTSVAEYWQGYEKRKAVTPILESIMMTKGVDYLDIAHLLPPIPRMLLNTFPDPTLLRADKSPDCTWTAVHFFRSGPSDRLMDFGEAVQEIEAIYEPATDDARFGDLLTFVKGEDERPIHVAVYIAADIAFTKNGNGLFVPWVLMRISDIEKLYSKDRPVSIKRSRLVRTR